jgi:hypothetical protein
MRTVRQREPVLARSRRMLHGVLEQTKQLQVLRLHSPNHHRMIRTVTILLPLPAVQRPRATLPHVPSSGTTRSESPAPADRTGMPTTHTHMQSPVRKAPNKYSKESKQTHMKIHRCAASHAKPPAIPLGHFWSNESPQRQRSSRTASDDADAALRVGENAELGKLDPESATTEHSPRPVSLA